MSRRTEQSASVLHRAIQQVITRGFADPRLDGCLLTVTEVRVSPDMREAIVRISVLPAVREKRAIAAIQAAARHIRHEVDNHVRARRTPQLLFRLDSATKRQAGVLAALARARAEDPSLLETGDTSAEHPGDHSVPPGTQPDEARQQSPSGWSSASGAHTEHQPSPKDPT